MISKSKIALGVRFYAEESGKEPVLDWLRKLDSKSKKIIGDDIKTVQIGWPVGMPLVRSLGSSLWEIRSNLDKRIARIIFVLHGKSMILLHGFIKKSQKVPLPDLNRAKKRAKNVLGG